MDRKLHTQVALGPVIPHLIFIPTGIDGNYRIFGKRNPVVQVVFKALVDADAASRHVGDDCRNLGPANNSAAVEIITLFAFKWFA